MKLFNYWRSSSSYRVRLALHFKGISFEYVPVSLVKGEQHEGAHRNRSPAGYVPVLEVEEAGQRVSLGQSVAIFEYLEERFPQRPLLPTGAAARAQVRAMGELVNSGIQPFHNLSTLNHLKGLGVDEKRWAAHWIESGLTALEALAAQHQGQFLYRDQFSWADCCLLPQLFAARRFGASVERYSRLLAIEQRCSALPFVRASVPEAQPDAQPS